MDDLTEFEKEIEIALNRTAKGVAWQDRDDLRQEARIAVLAAVEALGRANTPKAMAYKLARNRIIDVLRKRPPFEEDIDKPSVRRAVEKTYVHFPDLDTKIDAEKAALLTSNLPVGDAIFIQNLFGIDCEPHTATEMARVLDVSEDKIDRRKKRILARLKFMMTGER